MSRRGISLVGTLTALLLCSSSALAQEPAPWETGAPPEEEAEGQKAEEQEPEAEPEPAPEPAPAPEPEPMEDDLEAGAEGDLPPVGDVGFGYFSTSAPLGVRMWMTDRIGFDAGLGFSIDTTTEDVAWGLSAEGGLLFALATFENLIVFARGGLGVGINDNGTPGADVGYDIVLNGMLGAEFFMTEFGFPNLSFTGGVGVQVDLMDQPGQDFGVQVASAQSPVNLVASAVLGFHIYL